MIVEIYEIIHQSNIISSEMLRLVQNLNFYIMFEVLECSWKTLCEELSRAKDMDQVIAANENFIETIISQLLLDPKSKVCWFDSKFYCSLKSRKSQIWNIGNSQRVAHYFWFDCENLIVEWKLSYTCHKWG